MNEENTATNPEPARKAAEGIPLPEEVLEHIKELPEEQRLRPVRCQAGRKDNACERNATTYLWPESREYPACSEHARAWDAAHEVMDRSVVEDITGDWLRIAQTWGFGDLEQLAENAHESAKEALMRAEARADLAREIADAPAKRRRSEKIAELTPEQDAKLARLILRSDALVTARTVLEDAPEVEEEVKRRTLGILVFEAERATEEAHRYSEELGLEPESGRENRSCA